MKTMFLNRYLIASFLLLPFQKGFAQCAAPTAGTATAVASTCTNNGKITITGVSGGATVNKDTTLEYAIMSYSGSGPAIPVIYQSSNEFTNLFPGTYQVAVRHNCQGAYSGSYSISSINVTDAYTPMRASVTVLHQQSNCRKAKFSVAAADGYTATAGAYRYQLVNGLTAGIWDTLAKKQTSNVFVVDAGTYYVRIYDDCGAYITRSVEVGGSNTPLNPYGMSFYNKRRFVRIDCGSFAYNFFTPGSIVRDQTYLAPTNAKTYLFDPLHVAIDSSADATAGTKPVDISAYLVPAYAKTVGSLTVFGPFYERVKDSCGTVFYSDSLYIDTTTSLTASLARTAPRCDTANYTLSFTETGSNYTGALMSTGNYRVRASNNGSAIVAYTSDSGVTWSTNPVSLNVINTAVKDQKWGIRACGTESWAMAPAVNLLNAGLIEANAWACRGNTGLVLNPSANFGSGTYDSSKIRITAAPAGYSLPLSMVFTNKGKNAADPADPDNYLFNLPAGTYSYIVTNECGETQTGTVNAANTRDYQVTVNAAGSCETGKIQISARISTTQQGSSAINTAGGATRFRYTVRNSRTGVYINTGGAAGATANMAPSVVDRQLTTAALDAVDTGWYVVTVWVDTNYVRTHGYCPVQDSVRISAVGSLLRAAADFNACKADGTGSVIITHSGGLPPYKYELLDITSGTKYGPKTTNEFAGLNLAHTYEARVTDTCGNTSANTNTFDTVSTQVIMDGTACAGTDVTLRLNDVPGGVYRWIRGTDTVSYFRTLSLSHVGDADTGKYVVLIRTAACSEARTATYRFKVNAIPAAPGTTLVAYCAGAGASALTATGTALKWYDAAAGGTGVATAPTPVTTDADTFTYYVSQTSAAGCESPRASLTVQVNPVAAAAPVVTSPVSYCAGATATALTATGDNLIWYTAATGGTGTATAPTPATTTAGTTKHYVAQRTEAGCAGARAEIAVVINAKPALPAVTTPVAYCKDAATTALAATGDNLSWYTEASGGTAGTVVPVPASDVVKDSSFYVSQTSAEGCESNRAKIVVSIKALPAAPVVSGPVELCSGAAAGALSATGDDLTWYTDATGGTGSPVAPVPVTATVTTLQYYVSQTNAAGCEGPRALLEVNVNPLPAISIATRERPMPVFCVGSTLTLEAIAPTATTYQWSIEGAMLPGATYDTLAAGVTGSFKVTVTNIHGCQAEAELGVMQDTTRLPELSPAKLSFCTGSADILTCMPFRSGFRYTWMKDGAELLPATPTSNLRIVSEPGNYSVNVTNNFGCEVMTNTSVVSYYPALVKPTVIRSGRILSLSSTYDYYQWYKDGMLIPGATAGTHYMSADGNYHAVVFDRNGCQINSDTLFADRVSIPELNTRSQVKVYPNPTQSVVKIETANGMPVQVAVMDLTGHLVLRRTATNEADLSGLPDGLYFLSISDAQGAVISIEQINKVSTQ